MSEFIPPSPLNTAVLFLVFNRLDTTMQVFDAIRQAKPPRLYVAADGARPSQEGEPEKVQAVRDYVLQHIDWDCEVNTLFRDENLGCKYAVSGAIDWFFKNEEMGIILEDDCLPSQSFFWFCEVLLERYKDDMRIGHIGGYNHFPQRITESDYYYSTMPGIWGWATWANRWSDYDVDMKDLGDNKNKVINRFYNKQIGKYWLNIFENCEQYGTWDYQWTYCLIKNNLLTIRPSCNLVYNIGFGGNGTHTQAVDINILRNKSTDISTTSLVPPGSVYENIVEDNLFFYNRLHISLIKKIIRRIKNAIF